MKKLVIVVLFAIGFIGQNLFAQAVDSKGRVIDSKGDVYIDGTKLGSVTMDSIVKNANGKPMAFLDSDVGSDAFFNVLNCEQAKCL